MAENKVEAPAMFPPTFLYTTSWEDPRPDVKVWAASGLMQFQQYMHWADMIKRWRESLPVLNMFIEDRLGAQMQDG